MGLELRGQCAQLNCRQLPRISDQTRSDQITGVPACRTVAQTCSHPAVTSLVRPPLWHPRRLSSSILTWVCMHANTIIERDGYTGFCMVSEQRAGSRHVRASYGTQSLQTIHNLHLALYGKREQHLRMYQARGPSRGGPAAGGANKRAVCRARAVRHQPCARSVNTSDCGVRCGVGDTAILQSGQRQSEAGRCPGRQAGTQA